MPRKTPITKSFTPRALHEDDKALLDPTPAQQETHHERIARALEGILVEVASLRAGLVSGLDTLQEAVLAAAVTEAEPVGSTPTLVHVADIKPEPLPAGHANGSGKVEAAPDLEDVKRALNRYTKATSLAQAGAAVAALGVKRLTELPPERYAEAIEALGG